MGRPMAENLQQYLSQHNLPPLTIWNRSPDKLLPASTSVLHAKSILEVALTCDIIITSLANDTVARLVYDELFAGAKEKNKLEKATHKKGIIFIESSTLYPTLVGQLEREACQIEHCYYLQAPVFGPPAVVSFIAKSTPT